MYHYIVQILTCYCYNYFILSPSKTFLWLPSPSPSFAILTFAFSNEQRLLKDSYKIIHCIDRVERKPLFSMSTEQNGKTSRLSADTSKLILALSNTDIRWCFFSNWVLNKWNSLPANIKQAKNTMQFKQLYDIGLNQ